LDHGITLAPSSCPRAASQVLQILAFPGSGKVTCSIIYAIDPIIERKLTDEQMLQFMGRENGEDYKSDFNIMLNTWDGAIKFSGTGKSDVEIARLLRCDLSRCDL